MGLFTRDIKTMNDLFVHQLQDTYYAEQQLVKALPKMAEKAMEQQLKQGLLSHLEETKGHVERLERLAASARAPQAWRSGWRASASGQLYRQRRSQAPGR
jgi:ferritin-like metal-binding protein YciE